MSNVGEKFRWVAYDRNGAPYRQIEDNGQKNSYESLPHDNLLAFELWDWQRNERVLLVTFKHGERLVWRRRYEMNADGGVNEACHIVGKIGKDGTKGIVGIFESDGRIEATSEFLPNSNWFYPPSSEQGDQSTDG